MVDVFSILLGFTVGVILVVLAIEIGLKKTSQASPASKPTKSWSISEISNPRIMAEYLSDVDLPSNSKVIVKKYKNKDALSGLNVKQNRGIRGNYVLGDDRALILSGPVREDEMGIWTVEKEIVEELKKEFDRRWVEGSHMEWDET
jgi:hypothetical protein